MSKKNFKFNFFKIQILLFITLFFIILSSAVNITLILDYLNWFILSSIIIYIFYYSNLFAQILVVPAVAYGMQILNFLSCLKTIIYGTIL